MELDPVFLTIDEVLFIHEDQLARFGGDSGVRDHGLLRSALAQPEAFFGGQWLHDDLWTMAAAYTFHLVKNHPFVDGNKRIGTVCALHFLALNGQRVVALNEQYRDLILAIAEGRAGKDDLAVFLRTHAQPLPGR